MVQSLPLVQLQLLTPFLSGLTARGIDPEVVLDSVGLTPSAVEQEGGTVHVMVVHQFVENCAAVTGDKTFCASVGATLDPTGWPMIEIAMATARTLGEFLNIYVMEASKVASSVTAFLDTRGNTSVFGETRRFKPLIKPAQNDGFMIGLQLSMLQRALGDQLDSEKVILIVCDPAVLPECYKKFQILRGDDMGSRVQFPSEWLTAPLARIDAPEPVAGFSAELSGNSFLSSFRTLLRQRISMGGLSAKQAAELVHMKPRTLARQLADFGTTPSKELTAAKNAYAREVLTTSNKTIEDIALDLGYSDPSNFSRAFAKSFGVTPSQFRAQTGRT